MLLRDGCRMTRPTADSKNRPRSQRGLPRDISALGESQKPESASGEEKLRRIGGAERGSRTMSHFISEDDLKTFDGWLKYQGCDPATLEPNDLAEVRHD